MPAHPTGTLANDTAALLPRLTERRLSQLIMRPARQLVLARLSKEVRQRSFLLLTPGYCLYRR
jgi:hypothetical protein